MLNSEHLGDTSNKTDLIQLGQECEPTFLLAVPGRTWQVISAPRAVSYAVWRLQPLLKFHSYTSTLKAKLPVPELAQAQRIPVRRRHQQVSAGARDPSLLYVLTMFVLGAT